MKKILVFAMTSLLVLSACKKATTTPNTNSNNSGTGSTATLPKEYIIISDGTLSDTLEGYGNQFGNVYGDSNNTCIFHQNLFMSSNFHNTELIVYLPSDSTRMSLFTGNYSTGVYSSTGSFGKIHKAGVLGFYYKYDDKEPPFKSDSTNLNNSSYFNKINKIERVGSKWDDLYNKITVQYMIYGEFNIHCKQESTNKTKVITGKYKFKISSSI